MGGALRPSELYGGRNLAELCISLCTGEGGDPVDTSTGNFYFTLTDLGLSGRGIPLALSRTYNSLAAANDGPLGFGWTFNAASLLVAPATGDVTVRQENGSEVTFQNGAAGFTAAPRVLASLVRNGDGSYTFVRRSRERLTFASDGRVLSLQDRNGNKTTYGYDGGGRLSSMTDDAGRALTLTYTGSRISSARDGATPPRVVEFRYTDGNGNLTEVTDAVGGVTRYEYDGAHRIVGVAEPSQASAPSPLRLTNRYDSAGRVDSQTDQLGQTTLFAYTPGQTAITDPRGNVIVERYEYGVRLSETRGAGTLAAATWDYAYDSATLGIVSIRDPNGHVERMRYDSRGNLVEYFDALAQRHAWSYDGANNLLTQVAPSGATTTMTYDVNGNLVLVEEPLLGSAPAVVRRTQLVYGDPAHPGDLTTSIDPLGGTTTVSYDAVGSPSRITDPEGGVTALTNDVIGRVVKSVPPRGNAIGATPAAFETTYTYNALGLPLTVTDPLGNVTSRVYDANQNLVSVVDGNNTETEYTYDALDRAIGESRGDGSQRSTTYDGAGNISTQLDDGGAGPSYAYDALDRLRTATDANGQTTTYRYDKGGNTTSILTPRGGTTAYTYDAADRVKAVAYSDGTTPAVAYEYDSDGRRTRMIDGVGSTSFTYDSFDRVTSATRLRPLQQEERLSYTYDVMDRVTRITYPGGTRSVNRGYDKLGRLTSVTDWLANVTTYGYDSDGNLTSQIYPNGVSAALSYDNAGRLTRSTHRAANRVVLDLPYTWDDGNRLTAANAAAAPTSVAQSYSYDGADRLLGATSTPASPIVPAATYRYDRRDNLTFASDRKGDLDFAYNPAHQLTSMTNRTTALQSTFKFDDSGNRVEAAIGTAITTYRYDQENRLTGVSVAGAPITTYTYDGDSLRGDLLWDRSQGLPLAVQDPFASYVTGVGGLPLERIDAAGNVTYYHQDLLGNTRALTTGDGRIEIQYSYDPYGKMTSSVGAAVNPFLYGGHYTDPVTGLVYMRARYYDPQTAQFLTRDPAEFVTRAPYSYAGNSPVNFRDPTGLSPRRALLNAETRGWSESEIAQKVAFDTACATVSARLAATRAAERRANELKALQPAGWANWTGEQKRSWVEVNTEVAAVRLEDSAIRPDLSLAIQLPYYGVACYQGGLYGGFYGGTLGPHGALVGMGSGCAAGMVAGYYGDRNLASAGSNHV